ncbi:unnamed protein product [Sphenostylis stenocarpa]|uniref:Uncharacterized protein n=1 Tax=Sphenostylis stenocarpa TaxID=92480 RepID=A0AA86W0N8_9FABA|nr:unnamed protein product [Sphenostylis stenocarpa]
MQSHLCEFVVLLNPYSVVVGSHVYRVDHSHGINDNDFESLVELGNLEHLGGPIFELSWIERLDNNEKVTGLNLACLPHTAKED